jgi:hypothetical protein
MSASKPVAMDALSYRSTLRWWPGEEWREVGGLVERWRHESGEEWRRVERGG